MKATITSLIFLLLSLTVSSQTYKYIGIEEGLSNQKIYKIQKDARGYMWFLTHVGIDQYNGKEIKHYKLREGNRELDPLLNINWTFLGEFYQFNLSSCIRQQNSLTAQFVSFSLSNLANIFYPPQFLQ